MIFSLEIFAGHVARLSRSLVFTDARFKDPRIPLCFKFLCVEELGVESLDDPPVTFLR